MALLLLALVAAQIIGAVILFDEHRLALTSAKRDQVMGRVAAMVRILTETPQKMHGDILDAASTVQLSFWLTDTNTLNQEDDDGDEDEDSTQNPFSKRLARILDQPADRPIHVSFEEGDLWSWKRHHKWMSDHHERHEKHDERDDDDLNPPGLNLSLQLSQDSWLNATYRITAPQGIWAKATLLSLFLMGLAVCGVTFMVVRRITRPLATLAAAADALGRGEDGPELKSTGPLEIQTTTTAFNQMRDRLHRFVDDRTRMLAAISHDLRSPLTSLRLRAEMIEDPEIKSKILETLLEMQNMTEATLAFASDDANKEETRDTDLNALIDSITLDLQDMGQDVSFTPPQDTITYRCRLFALKRAIRNLVENAVRYGERARITQSQTEQSIHITIEDDGPGIPPENLDRVFEPFVRLETSRNLVTGGIGLGLAIARNIIHAHGGEIRLENGKDKGLKVVVILPK